jgi:hypothetical protein
MIAMLQFATLVITTIFAVAAAAGLQWLCLKAAFLMMRPATARRIPARTELVRGTAQLARAYSATRWAGRSRRAQALRIHSGWTEACATGLWEMEKEGTSMLALKYFLMLLGAGLFGSAGALVAYDIFLSEQLRRLLSSGKKDESGADWKARAERKLARNPFTLRVNFLGGSAGQGLR